MDIFVKFETISRLFAQVSQKGRDYLFEHEVYELIRLGGAETIPLFHFLPRGERLDPEKLEKFKGDKIVAKVVSPHITHKSDVGGVRVVEKNQEKVLSAIRAIMYEVPVSYAARMERNPLILPEVYKGLKGEDLVGAVAKDISGVLLCHHVPGLAQEFGDELIVSLRRNREFGMIITAGLGGTDTELYAKNLKKGRATVVASTAMTDGESFFKLFKKTIAFKKLTGLTRRAKRIVTDEQLIECFSAFIALGNYFSPVNPNAEFIIQELEINPFAFTDYLMLPLDGQCRFSKPEVLPGPRPVKKLDKLFHPESIGIIGVSSKTTNVGRIILDNILANGFDPLSVTIVHPGTEKIAGLDTIPGLEKAGKKFDLLVLAVDASKVPELVDEIINKNYAETVLLIPGGLGEKEGSEEKTRSIQDRIINRKNDGPIFIGGNSLGILSHPGRYDTFFIPEDKLPKHRGDYQRTSAFISQSGAYMITRMSKLSFLDPAYAISIGNQIDITAGDIISYIDQMDSVKTIVSYMEGFKDMDGLAFAKAVRRARLKGKDVIFYKAGRTPEGKTASTSHTASLASDYKVCESCIRQAGAMVASTFTVFEGLFRLSTALHNKNFSGNRLAAVSNAGYESVGIADNILGEDYQLRMARLSSDTKLKLTSAIEAAGLQDLVNIKNPMDITPMAGEGVYEVVIESLLNDPGVNMVVAALVPLTPILNTLEDAYSNGTKKGGNTIVQRISRLAERSDKPLVIVVDSGRLYDPLADAFQASGLPVFRSADQAILVLGKYTTQG